MGVAAEKCADKYGFSREASDAYAIETYTRAQKAHEQGLFDGEIVPVEVPQGRGKPPKVVSVDEEVTKFNPGKMSELKTPFKPAGTVTAANASSLSDGAAAVVVVSAAKLAELRASGTLDESHPVFKISGWADAAQEPVWFTVSPSLAIPKAVAHAQKRSASGAAPEIDYYEINEAFSVVALANNKILGLDAAQVNVFGGAVGLGHPLGCSGCRIVVTLCNVLSKKGGRTGVAAICNGGGGASAAVIE
ncbi:hypothetical protein GQ42DRAFT_165135, partial [Ramicandelaber brevisporus]